MRLLLSVASCLRFMTEFPPTLQHDTFAWLLEPPGGTFFGDVYTDGSRLDGPSPVMARNGWSFVVLDASGAAIAAAFGVPPPVDCRYTRHGVLGVAPSRATG